LRIRHHFPHLREWEAFASSAWDVAHLCNDERMGLPLTERLKVWVRAGGICAICKSYLLESSLTAREVTRGELAHNVGQKQSARSPRGMHSLPEAERDTADNVVLLCRKSSPPTEAAECPTTACCATAA
jgi:hypothetical protein